MGQYTTLKIYCKDPTTKVRLKKYAEEFGSYEKALIKLMDEHERKVEVKFI